VKKFTDNAEFFLNLGNVFIILDGK
jgi:hypothetical protein